MVNTVANALRQHYDALAPAERRVARVLLSKYPINGLETIAQLAKKSSASGPTVLRLVNKLGFESYSAFQEALRTELDAQLQSPVLRRDPNLTVAEHGFAQSYIHNLQDLLQQTANSLIEADFETAVSWLSNPKHRLWLLGGYITGSLAEYLCHHLQTIRPNVSLLRPIPRTWVEYVSEMGKNDVLIVFDIRRYWSELQILAQLAREQKCRIILVTDQWISPVSSYADLIFTAYTESKAGWDSTVSIMMLIDTLIANINNQDWEKTKDRLHQLEALRAKFKLD
ncbi:DNA-binding MurR/RpiR family transcriptional regulator [Neisseria sp. HSC-16F19]|nr:MurR/RpiR family transcriptional regulator [Neisseria sp. HSC-16F19]MCP2041204.1 DNA-binding MurR/RpiR family transcriptional regulator [Neisseria sp. HSC-16F19]